MTVIDDIVKYGVDKGVFFAFGDDLFYKSGVHSYSLLKKDYFRKDKDGMVQADRTGKDNRSVQ
jgi:hypothetical protein